MIKNVLFNYHTHTNYSDGKNTVRENVEKALELGFIQLGFSDHSVNSFYNESDGMYDEYFKEVSEIREEYKDRIKIYIGLEQDIYSKEPDSRWEYIIGSTHYLKTDDKYLCVDSSAKITEENVKKYFDGDYLKYAKEYYLQETKVAELPRVDIIGHFDLLTKFNEGYKQFDEDDKRYLNLAYECADVLLKKDVPFEINTGAIGRGYRTLPYPNEKILKYIHSKKGRIVITSDSHKIENLNCYFPQALELVKNCGFKSICRFDDGIWNECEI